MTNQSGKLTLLHNIFRETLEHEDVSFSSCLDKIANYFIGLTPPEKQEILALVCSDIDQNSRELSSKYSSACHKDMMIRDLELRILFLLECQKNCSSGSPEDVSNEELCDQISELAGRLGVCICERNLWKEFLYSEVTERYASTFGHTLTNVYLNLGLDPPDCLPKDDVTELTEKSFSSNLADEEPVSPRNSSTPDAPSQASRASLRNSLPRALFTDSALVAAAGVTNNLCSSSGLVTPDVQSAQIINPLSAPQLVLISCPRSRRKGRTPTKCTQPKRLPAKSRRSTKSKFSPTVSRQLTPNGSAKRLTANSKTPRSSERRRTSSSRSRRSNGRTPKDRPSTDRKRGESKTTPRARRHKRYVHETPNPKQSHPRWERAKLAAAEKTKDKAIIVEESPIKPALSLGSPLRRLRRANSISVNLHRIESSQGGNDSNICGSTVPVTPLAYNPNPSAALELLSNVKTDGCLSVAMSRAERWCRRQLEEELSLSQFSEDQSRTATDRKLQVAYSPGKIKLSPGTGLLCIPRKLSRQSSNLFANMTSPKRPAAPCSPRHPFKLSRKSISQFELQSPLKSSSLRPGPTPKQTEQAPLESIVASSPQKPNESDKPPNYALFTPGRSTPQMLTVSINSPVRRTRSRRQSGSCQNSIVPVSPQIFDEEAMFLGRDEFLNETNTTPSLSGANASLRTISDVTDEDSRTEGAHSAVRKRRRITPYGSPMKPPVFRLDAVLRVSDSVTPTRPGSPLRMTPDRHLSFADIKNNPIVSPAKFPRLVKPVQSPFAPLHVFNRPRPSEPTGGIVQSELLDNATLSSQSASTVVALRTRLFGNSDSSQGNGSRSLNCPPDKENRDPDRSSLAKTKNQDSTEVINQQSEESRHLWEESSLDANYSPGLRELRRVAETDQMVRQIRARGTRLRLSALPTVSAPSIRPRRSLFQ